MLRTLLGYAVLAIIGFFALKLLFGLLSLAFSLLIGLLWLAAVGFVVYLVLKLISPDLARRVHDTIAGNKAPPAA
jgi:hypothetical protein